MGKPSLVVIRLLFKEIRLFTWDILRLSETITAIMPILISIRIPPLGLKKPVDPVDQY
jgi:hypothetical protein